MRKVKIFHGSYETMENKINKWLKNNPTFFIISTSITNANNYGTVALSIVYEEKSGGFTLNS